MVDQDNGVGLGQGGRMTLRSKTEAVMRLGEERSLPRAIRVDNGPQFISKRLGPVGISEGCGA